MIISLLFSFIIIWLWLLISLSVFNIGFRIPNRQLLLKFSLPTLIFSIIYEILILDSAAFESERISSGYWIFLFYLLIPIIYSILIRKYFSFSIGKLIGFFFFTIITSFLVFLGVALLFPTGHFWR
jgi:hypothetical protein